MSADDRSVLRDRELIELLADEPELLAILDAYATTQAKESAPVMPSVARGRALRRWRTLGAGLAVAAVVFAVALIPLRLGDHEVDLAARALAAVSTGPVLHAVLELPVSDITNAPGPVSITVLDPVSGRERQAVATLELWYDPGQQLLRLVQRNEGAVVWEQLERPEGVRDSQGRQEPGGSPTIESALVPFFKGYKRALEDGSAIVVDEGVVGGRAVSWLRFPPSGTGRLPQEGAVDRRTYQPLFLRSACEDCLKPPPTSRVVTLEGISQEAADFSPPVAQGRQADAPYDDEHQVISISEAASALGREALWAGATLNSLQLASLELVQPSSRSDTPSMDSRLVGRGLVLRLVYSQGGLVDDRGRATSDESVTIGESVDYEYVFSGFNFNKRRAGQPLTIAGGAVPPEGQVALTSTQADHWTAQLRKNGLYVEINGSSRELVLDAVRALTPLRP